MEPICPDAIDPPSNVLLVHAAHSTAEDCRRLRHADGDIAELRVSFSDERPEHASDEERPARLGFVSVGDVLRAASADDGLDFTQPIVVDAVENPNDLSAIGLSVSRFCEHWGSTDEQLVVCFHSLDALLRHAPPKKVFQFTHVLTNRLSNVGALSHFHLDPSAHDDRVVGTFGTIFDEVVADETARDSIPEATDEDVARMLEEWTDGGDSGTRTDRHDGAVDEATDEEIARLLSE